MLARHKSAGRHQTGKVSSRSRITAATSLLLSIGDSVMWGQGLLKNDKFCYKVAHKLSRRLNIDLSVCNLAHSGATAIARGVESASPITDPSFYSLDDSASGEVPRANPTALEQAMNYSGDSDAVRYVLVNGSINDVSIYNILNPSFDRSRLDRLIEQHCHREINVLLRYVACKFAKATILLLGYFPILSTESNPAGSLAFLVTYLHGGAELRTLTIDYRWEFPWDLAMEFWRKSTDALQAAVKEVGEPERVVFVASGFTEENALFAREPLLRQPTLEQGLFHDLVDDMRYDDRLRECPKYDQELYPRDQTAEFYCRNASLGHPTESGADRYASSILKRLLH